jgi:HPt (histidine-containing phosphotransfer) domain-containing protein
MFIIDSDHRLIAAEENDLKTWNAADLYEAARWFREGRLRLDIEHSRLEAKGGEVYDYEIGKMESLLGNWYLCRPAVRGEQTAETTRLPSTEEENLEILPLTAPEAPEKEGKEEIPSVSEETSLEEESLELFPLESGEETSISAPESTESVAEEETPPKEPELDEEIEALLHLGDEENDIGLLSPEEEREQEEARARNEEEELLPLLGEEEEIPGLQSQEESEEELPALGGMEEPLSPDVELPELQELLDEKQPHEEPLFPIPEVEETAPWKEIAESFQPDLGSNAARLELSDGEYTDLVREFIEDSRTLKNQLLSDNEAERGHAVAVLKDAIVLLHLSPLDRLLEMAGQAGGSERVAIVEEFEASLQRLETILPGGVPTPPQEPLAVPRTEESAPDIASETRPPVAEPGPRDVEAPRAPEPSGAETPAEAEGTPLAETEEATPPSGDLDTEEFLQGVKPIPIEFSLQIASQELNLPEELVLEFINDFAKQGHEYLPVLIEAYRKKDLDHLQKTAHMLKGAASNLRIEAMVDNLYDLQFDNNLERAPQRIRLFAGQLMSLDKYLEQMNG